jgi:hypothetical protein
MIALDAPLRMLGYPLGKVGLGIHDALIQRELRAKLESLLLAPIWLCQRTNRDDDRYQVHKLAPPNYPVSPDRLGSAVMQLHKQALSFDFR